MDHFEGIVKTLLEQEGYWVRQSFKINLTKQEKRDIGKPSMPRPEIDLLAFKPSRNEILAIEVKSFFDSGGVRLDELQNSFEVAEGRYKLFTCRSYREILFGRLRGDLIEAGMAGPETHIVLGLVAGNVYQSADKEIRTHFWKSNWFFWSPEDVRSRVNALASKKYENEPAVITAKILMKDNCSPTPKI